MNKRIIIIVFSLAILACSTNKEQDSNSDSTVIDSIQSNVSLESITFPIENEVNIQNLQKSFIAKDETQFLNQFPKDFEQFCSYFGWDYKNDNPEELYDESNNYIDYWFDLLNNEKFTEYELQIIEVSKNGEWYPDAVNYFQDKSYSYIKEKQKYNLINELKDIDAKSVLFFLFDGPSPQIDADFASHLNASKKSLLDDLFEIGLFDNSENPDPEEQLLQTDNISFYSNNDSYFLKNIDINKDGKLDKIVSSKRYQGDELLVFINTNNTYELALKTINFSEDGGNQIVDIKEDENGFVIVTSFPDRGFFESHFFVLYDRGHWVLTNTIYKTMSSNQEDAFIYVCDVKQNIDISDSDLFAEIKSIPDESERDKLCIKEGRELQQFSTEYYEFTPATISNLKIDSFSIVHSFKLSEDYITLGYYENEKFPESNSDWGDRLICLDNNHQVKFKSIGVGDVYNYEPHFYKNNDNDKIIIICALSYEYNFGGDAFLVEKNDVTYIGNIDIEGVDFEKNITDIIKINESNDKLTFSFDADTLLLNPGGDDLQIINNNIKYEYQYYTFELLNYIHN